MKAHALPILKLINILLLILYFGSPAFAKPGDSQDLGGTVSQAGLFSYQAPKGWSVKNTPLSKYDVAVDAPRNNFVANINVVVESYPESLAKYVSLNKQYVAASGVYTVFQTVAHQRPEKRLIRRMRLLTAYS